MTSSVNVLYLGVSCVVSSVYSCRVSSVNSLPTVTVPCVRVLVSIVLIHASPYANCVFGCLLLSLNEDEDRVIDQD